MAVPWLRILDLVLGVTDLARGARASTGVAAQTEQLATGSRALGHLESRLTGVVFAALKEAFDRDTRRLQLEREQLDLERERAERALRLELARQAGEREIGRLRLIAGVAVVSWLATLVFAARLIGGPIGARIGLGIGWLLLLGALAAAFAAQSRVASVLDRIDDDMARRDLGGGLAGSIATWLVVAGLAVIGLAVLFA